ncbi:MAG: PadR family transcriptional regulator [Clostridia bacterium]|nr:PadR family transcriptional regulator [Clostridia bacterium]MDE6790249.1 PadR family transcriptional regulator [Clostridia bacterium]MDE7401548.1 PadR family transcriptional regulator [Clostridia bacterium]
MDAQIKKGVLDACVLYAISKGESYGYKIITDLQGVMEISESTLYPILKRLEAGGAVTTRTQEFNGRLRRYYKITPIGLDKLNESKRDFEAINAIYLKIFGGKR